MRKTSGRSKRSTALGIIVGLAVGGFVLSQVDDYLEAGTTGTIMLAASLACAVVSALAIMFKPDREANNYSLRVFFIFLICPMLNVISIERLNGNFINELVQACWIDNYLVCLLIYLLAFAIFGSVRISALLLSPAMLLFGMANMYLKEFRGEPLVPMDVGSVSTAMTVVRGYTFSFGVDVSFAVAVCVLAMALTVRLSMPAMGKKAKIILRLLVAIVVTTVAYGFYATDLFVNWGYRPDFFNQMRGYNKKGALLEFTVNTRYLHSTPPEGYDPKNIGKIVDDELASYDGKTITESAAASGPDGKNTGAEGKRSGSKTDGAEGKRSGSKTDGTDGKSKSVNIKEKPDIIVIMDEAFSDLTVNGDVQTDNDPIPNLNRLKKESLQGYAYVSVFGAGTSNTEFEFLTGNSMAFLPPASNAYQLYSQDTQPGLAKTLKDEGYTTHAYHPYFRGNWNRPKVYESMGFDEYRAIEDMFSSKFIDQYLNNPNAKYTLNKLLEEEGKSGDIFLRRYISDAYDFSEVIENYEKRDKSKPYFMFNVTMQNHSPYDLYLDEKYNKVDLTGMSGTYPKAEEYLSIIYQTDAALGDLIAYFKKTDRPVIILFFGDHQPSIESDFYKEITGSMPDDMEGMTKMNRFSTRFLMWSNYGTPTGWIDRISVNYLQAMLLENTGLAMPKYQKYLESMYEKFPVVTGQGSVGSDGSFYDSSGEADGLADYGRIVYNNLMDEDNRVDEIF